MNWITWSTQRSQFRFGSSMSVSHTCGMAEGRSRCWNRPSASTGATGGSWIAPDTDQGPRSLSRVVTEDVHANRKFAQFVFTATVRLTFQAGDVR